MKKITLLGAILLAIQGFAQFPAPYCGPLTNTSGTEPITLVNFAGINNVSSNVLTEIAHENFTLITGNVLAGSTYPIKLKGNTDGAAYGNNFSVFVDWNQNQVFTDAGETYNVGRLTGSTGIDAAVLSGIIEVPASALAGSTRMRVVKRYNSSATIFPTPCLTGVGFGQAEDYTIAVTIPTCFAPTAGLSAGVTATSANLSWSSLNFNFEIKVQTAGTGIPLDADNTGVNVSALTYTATLPTANTNYEYYVRSECVDGTSFSTWSGPYLFNNLLPPTCAVLTSPANLATNVPVTVVNDQMTASTRTTTITLSWTAPTTPVAGYRIFFGRVEATIVSLNATGVPFNGLTVPISGILYNTTYYWKIVPESAAGLVATNCVTNSFTTGPSPGSCTNGILAPATTFTPATCDGTTVNTITTAPIRAGRYSNVVLTSGQTYKFASSVATDFFTISTDDGLTAASFGATPFTWTSNFEGTARVYVHLSNQCDPSLASSTRTTTVICGASLAVAESFDADNFKIYPNPVNDILSLSFDKNITNVVIYNLLGQEVLTKSINDTKSKIDISALVNGSYIVKITADDKVKVFNVIKE